MKGNAQTPEISILCTMKSEGKSCIKCKIGSIENTRAIEILSTGAGKLRRARF